MAITRTESWSSSFAQAEPFIRSAIDKGMSFNAFYDIAKETAISYRRTNMLEDWRQVSGVYLNEWSLNQMSGDAQVRLNQTTEGRAGQRSAFLAGVEYSFLDTETGEMVKNVRMIASSELLTKSEYLAAATEWLEPGGAYYDPSITGVTLRFVQRAPRVSAY
jgi:hypothetical protein